VRGRAVADIACGTGSGSELLRTAGGAARVVGVDIDAEAVAYARAAHAPDGVEFACAPGERTGLPDASVEVVVSFETIEHVPSDRALLAEFARVLRPGGVLVCSTPNRWPLAITPHHVREYDRAGFAAALGEWFGDIRMYNQNSGSNWPYNHGQPAGICPTTPDNEELAECFIAVARKAGGGDQPGAPQ
jgi:ubiquinone/menaquinone biosynthesis C-methylase UbiE